MAGSIGWGVIGSGGIAKRRTIPEGIVPASNVRLVAVYDINHEVNKAVAAEFGCTASSSIDELMSADIQAVYVASPVHLHYGHVMTCAKAGKNVLCEKPLGMNSGEVEKMISDCKEMDVKLGTAFMMRFHTQHQAALKMIREGRIGQPVYARAQLSCWYPSIEGAWRQQLSLGGGGSLIDMGGHCIDLLEMFYGHIKRVSCFVNRTIHSYESEDSAVAMLSFENGAIGTVDAFFCIPDNSSKNVLELYGSRGSILAKGTIGQGEAGEMTAYLEEEESDYDARQARTASSGFIIAPTPVNTYKAEIEEFSGALLDNRDPMVGPEVGLRSQKILTACYESARTGKAIDIE